MTADDTGSRPTGRSTTPAPGPSGASGAARDATTLLEVLRAFEERGFEGEFAVRDDGTIASDPADMLAVAALVCANCGTRGTLVLNYGPLASAEDAAVLRELDEPPPPSPDLGTRTAQ